MKNTIKKKINNKNIKKVRINNNKTNIKTNDMNKSLGLICLIMIILHLAGLTYQFIAKVTTFAIILKISYILMFTIFFILLMKNSKYAHLFGIIFSAAIIIISGINMDFLSVAVSIIIIYYIFNNNLNKNIYNNSNTTNKKTK